MPANPAKTRGHRFGRASRRHRARQEAIKVLYELDLNPGPSVEEVVNRPRVSDQEISAEVRTHAQTLAQGVMDNREELDRHIVKFANRQRLDLMAVVDRNILRLAVYELLYQPDVPLAVTMNEAVLLASSFGDSETSAFVNGLLSRLAAELEIEARKTPAAKG